MKSVAWNGHAFKAYLPILIALVICLCHGRSLEATCGDHLSGSAGSGHQFDMTGEKLAPFQSDYVPHRLPCWGPQCRQRDPLPTTPTREVTPSIADDLIVGGSVRLMRGIDVSHGLRQMIQLIADGSPQRIFRPPRAA